MSNEHTGAEAPESLSLLVVDDNPYVLASAVKIFKSAQFQVLEAQDANRALEIIGDLDVSIDLLCIDGIIPGVGSAFVIQAARSRRPGIAILVCSGHVEEELIRRGIRAHQLAFVRKPFGAASLLAGVREALGHTRELHSNPGRTRRE